METYNAIDVHHSAPGINGEVSVHPPPLTPPTRGGEKTFPPPRWGRSGGGAELLHGEEIDIVILSGGEGTRLRKVLSDRPKPMAEINNRPFLDILIEHISSYGFKRFILCTGYRADFIQEYYSHAKTSQKILFSEETIPLGTGGAVKNAEKFIQSNPFLVMNGDSFCPVNMYEFVDFHKQNDSLLSMVIVESENLKDFGLLALDSAQKIINFKEKIERRGGTVHPLLNLPHQGGGIQGNNEYSPPLVGGVRGGGELLRNGKSYINAGIYLFDKDVLSMIPQHVKYSLEYDLFPKLVGGKFYGFITKENLMDIGTPERYEHAKKFFKNEV